MCSYQDGLVEVRIPLDQVETAEGQDGQQQERPDVGAAGEGVLGVLHTISLMQVLRLGEA
jgi:hypothetical protein